MPGEQVVIRTLVHIPLGHDHQPVRALGCVIPVIAKLYAIAESGLCPLTSLWIVRANVRPFPQQVFDAVDSRRFTDVIGPRLECDAPNRNPLAGQRSEVTLDGSGKMELLPFVRIFNRRYEMQIRVVFSRTLSQSADVFAEAASAVSRSRIQEEMTDPRVAGQSGPHRFDVGPDRVAIAGEFVDQRHPAREETVSSQLGDDRRFRISELQQSRFTFRERRVQVLHEVSSVL